MSRPLARFALHALWVGTLLSLIVPSVADPDLWGHVLFGRLLLDGHLPSTNAFAYTAATHPWVNHELLAEAVFAVTFDRLGAAGLVLLKTVLGVATLALVWRSARRRSGDELAATLAVVCAALAMREGFAIRPQLFTFAFLALTLDLLAAAGWRARGRAWLVPLVAIVWTNTHGGVLAGIGLAGVAVGATAVRDLAAGTLTRRDLAATALFGAALTAAPAVNPYGIHLPIFLLTEVTPRVPIGEWAPVTWIDASFLAFKVLLLATAAWIAATRRLAAAEAAILACAASFALLHRRHIPLFAIVSAPIVAAMLVDLWTRAAARLDVTTLRRAAVPAVVAIALVQSAAAGAAVAARRSSVVVDPREYPVQAMRFLAQNGIAGNVALPFRWGEYALWTLPAGSRIAVDGRFTTSYPADLLDDAWRFMAGTPGWNRLLTRHPTDVVVADRTQAPARLLSRDPEWQYVYSDPISIVFVRKVPSQAQALARFQAGELRYDRGPLVTEFPAAPQTAPGSATLMTAWTRS